MLCYVMLCYVMLCYVMLCYVMLCYVMLCYVMLCYVMLCYVGGGGGGVEPTPQKFSSITFDRDKIFLHSRQTVKIPLQSPGKLSIFLVLSLFFRLSLPKIWQAHPHKSYIFKINKDRSITSRSVGF